MNKIAVEQMEKDKMKYIINITGGFCAHDDILFISENGEVSIWLANDHDPDNCPDKYNQEYMNKSHCTLLGLIEHIPNITKDDNIIKGSPIRGMDTIFYNVYLPDLTNILKMEEDSFWICPEDSIKCSGLKSMVSDVSQMVEDMRFLKYR